MSQNEPCSYARYFAALSAALLSPAVLAQQCNLIGAPEQVFSDSPLVFQEFGEDVDIHNDVAIVGTRVELDSTVEEGTAYIFRRGPASWILEQVLEGDERSFGHAVAVSADVVAVGAPRRDSWSGAVYVYRYDGSAWALEQTLFASDSEPGGRFGDALSMDGHRLIVGTSEVEGPVDVNKAYIFRWTGISWVESQKLVPETGDLTALFGSAVSISGDWALVGGPGDDDDGFLNASGSASFYHHASGEWTLLQKVLPAGDSEGLFGFDVCVKGNRAIVGGRSAGSWSYVYQRVGSTWVQEERLEPADGVANSNFGWAVAIDDDMALVGAPDDGAGSVYQYCWDGSSWEQANKFEGGALNGEYGYALAINRMAGIAGAPGSDMAAPLNDTGAAFLYEFASCPKVPLGGSLTATEDPGCFKVFVPTKWGGALTVSADDGAIVDLCFPDGEPFTNGADVGQDRQGWFTFQVAGVSGSYTVSTEFVQRGVSEVIPWNYYYFPYVPGTAPRLYDVDDGSGVPDGALAKYDEFFGLDPEGRDWEVDNHRGNSFGTWEGHCGGATVASILLDPLPTSHPAGFTQDELEGLGAMFFKNHLQFNRRLARFSDRLELREATLADTDPVDKLVHGFHAALRHMLRERRRPFLISLRQDAISTPAQIWNYACYEYSADLREDPMALGDEETEKVLQIDVTTDFFCNEDFVDPPTKAGVSASNPVVSPDLRRELCAEYKLVYGQDGRIRGNGSMQSRKQNWLSLTLVRSLGVDRNDPIYVPWTMVDFTSARGRLNAVIPFESPNPWVTSDRLSQLGLAVRAGF